MALFSSGSTSRLRSQDMAALQRALESERSATRSAQERAKELQQALDSERSAVRALRREAAAQARAAKDQEAAKHAALVDQLKTRMELVRSEAVAQVREQTTREMTAQFQRELEARQGQWRLESRAQLETLQNQLKEALKANQQVTPQSQTDALVHSLHADFHRSLRQKQEEWRKETKEQVEVLTSQLRELQRQHTDTCHQLSTTTNEAETIPKLRQEIHTLRLHNKELEEKIQILIEADRRKVEEFRAAHEDNAAKMADLQRAARKETFQLLEEMRGKDRLLAQLQRDSHHGHGHARASPYLRSRLEPETPVRTRLDQDRPGEPPRLCIKRPKSLAFTPDPNKRQKAQEGRKPPDPPEPDTATTKKDEKKHDESKNTNSLETLKEQIQGGPTSDLINDWTKKVGVETLYQLLVGEHQELQRTHHATCARLREEERLRLQLEEQLRDLQCRKGEGDNAINLALAEQLQALTERRAELEAEVTELREQNDLLEFRILELDDGVCGHSCSSFQFKSPPSRSPDTRDREMDDISDSGVMSLPTSEDISEADFQDFKMDNNRDVKSKLAQLCQSLESVSERISVQQALALLRHYETRLETLEATLAAMCQEATQTKSFDHLPSTNMEHAKSPSRIIATVLPFTELSSTYNGKEARDDMPLKRLLRDQDSMQESGIFEDGALTSCLLHAGTQTDWTFDPPPGDLGAEIRKLAQIRERIEEKGGNKKLLKTEAEKEFLSHASIKELLFYRERLQILEDKLNIYESRGDEQARLLAMRLEKEVLLAAQVKHLQNTVRHLKEVNRYLEEEKCEFEEAENDTRLRCQKLEVKLSALGEKKSDLQVQLQQNARTMSNLRSSLSEEERKRNEARQYAAKMEALVNRLEQQHFEMEEKEMEIRYRLHTLENIVPAMVMYYLWRMLNAIRPYVHDDGSQRSLHSSTSDSVLSIKPTSVREERSKKSRSNRQVKADEQETLRRSLLEIEQFLSSKQKGENPESPRIGPDAAFILIEELSDRCHALEDKIDELEIKEKLYQETLQKGDDILNKMEKDYKQQLRCADEELIQKQSELEMAQSQLRKLVQSREDELQLQERVAQLEMELTQLQEASVQAERDKKALEGDKLRLTRELEEALDNLDKFKENVEKPLSEEVENMKIRIKDLLGDLDMREQEKYESDEIHRKLVKELKKINQQACRELEESEVTISELKEEVLTLEREVSDLRTGLSHERDRTERLLIQAGAELEAKDRQLRSLDSSPAGSLREELLYAAAEHRVDHKSTADAPAAGTPSTYPPATLPKCDCQKAEQVVKEFDPNSYNISVDEIASAYQHSRTCRQCRSTTAVELSQILSIVQKTASPSRIAQINHLLLLR